MGKWVIGVDSHAGSLTAVRVDGQGRACGQRRVRNTAAGQGELRRWVEEEAGERSWAVEGAGSYGWVLTRRLQEGGEDVREIPGWLTARERRRGGRPDKSDAQDALGAGRALLREPELPPARGADGATVLKLLSDERDGLVRERTRLINQLRASLRMLGAEVDGEVGALSRVAGARRALGLSLGDPDALGRVRRQQVRRLARRLLALHVEVDELRGELEAWVARIGTSLTAIEGCQALSAARLLGDTGDPAHYPKQEASYARYSGTAPREVSSGKSERQRLDRRGNRRLNAALHRIALTQARMPESAGQEYMERRTEEGKSTREARRALKRHLSNHVFRTIKRDIASGRTCLALT